MRKSLQLSLKTNSTCNQTDICKATCYSCMHSCTHVRIIFMQLYVYAHSYLRIRNILKYKNKYIYENKTSIYLILTKYKHKRKKRKENDWLLIHFYSIICDLLKWNSFF